MGRGPHSCSSADQSSDWKLRHHGIFFSFKTKTEILNDHSWQIYYKDETNKPLLFDSQDTKSQNLIK